MSRNSCRVFLTGASGFIGSHLLNFLQAQNINIVILDRDHDTELDLDQSEKNILLWSGEPSNIGIVNSNDYSEQKNLTNRLHQYLKNDFNHIIYLSSASVYKKNGKSYKNENDPVLDNDNYSRGKIERESLVLQSRIGCVLRLSNIYGLGMKGNIFNDINDQLFTESQNLYIRNLNSVFDLLYIDDLVNCLGKIIDLKLLGLFNLSSREETTPSEIVRNILDELNITKIVEETDPDKTSYLNVDNAKISEAILWKPQFNLAKGIRDLIKKGYFK